MRKPALLAVMLAFLALFFGWETWRAWRAPLPASDNGVRSPGVFWQPGATVPDPSPPPEVASMIAVVTARPLFRADRQPFGEASAGVPARNYEAELSRYTLLGVLSFGDDLKGLVVSRSGARTDRWEVKAGESFPGFTVKEVRTDSLVVTADEREFQLPLYAGSPNATGGALRTDVSRSAPASATTAPAPPAPRAGQAAAAASSASPARPQTPVPAAPPQRDIRPRYAPGRR